MISPSKAAVEAWARRVVFGRLHDQHRVPLAVFVRSPATAEGTFAVLPQDLRVETRICDVRRMRHHLSDSDVGSGAEVRLIKLARAVRPLTALLENVPHRA